MAQQLSVCRVVVTVVDDKTVESANWNGYNEVVFTKNTETIDAFSSRVLPIKVEMHTQGNALIS